MEKIKSWIIIILSAILGFGASELVDDKIQIPILEKPAAEIQECPQAIIIGYVGNDKYYCECIGPDCPCVKTDEILSQIG